MVWPTDDLTKTHLDAGTDSPANARAELEALIDKVKLILAEATAGDTIWNSTNTNVSSPGSFDFKMGFNDQVSRGSSGTSRALVKESGSVLTVNYQGDFTGGVKVDSNLNVAGTLTSTNNIDADLLNGQGGSYYNDLSNATGTLTNNVDTDSLTVNGSAITDIVNITKMYSGQVASGGTWTDQPGSWTVSAGGTSNSQYTITHNLGSSNYAVIATPIGATFKAIIVSKSTNSFVIGTLDSSNNVYSQAAFDFMLIHG